MSERSNHPVGYCSPPAHSRFEKGKSGDTARSLWRAGFWMRPMLPRRRAFERMRVKVGCGLRGLTRSLADFANGPSGWKRHKPPSCRSPSPSAPPPAWAADAEHAPELCPVRT